MRQNSECRKPGSSDPSLAMEMRALPRAGCGLIAFGTGRLPADTRIAAVAAPAQDVATQRELP